MTQQLPSGRTSQRSNRGIALLGSLLFLFGVGATAARTIVKYQSPGPFDPTRQGMCDFHNGVYFPTQALLAGLSPYGSEYADQMPVERQIPFFSPSILLLHTPFAMLPLRLSEILYFVYSVGLVIVLARLVVSVAGLPNRLDATAVAASAIIFSRPGHITLFDGYFTFELVLASLLAIHWAPKRPLLAALALVVVSAKPTFILPLGFLLLARGNFKSLTLGAVLSILAAAAPMAWLAYHEGEGDLASGAQILVGQIGESQELHRSLEDESPVHSWTRLDLLAVVAKWTGSDPDEGTHLWVMALLLAAPMLLLNHRRMAGLDDGVAGMTGAIVATAVLVSVYHQSYDALLLAGPVAGVVIGRVGQWQRWSTALRWSLAGLMLFPAYNYFSTRMVLGRLNPSPVVVDVLTSVNGICLAVLLVWLCLLAIRSTSSPSKPA